MVNTASNGKNTKDSLKRYLKVVNSVFLGILTGIVLMLGPLLFTEFSSELIVLVIVVVLFSLFEILHYRREDHQIKEDIRKENIKNLEESE